MDCPRRRHTGMEMNMHTVTFTFKPDLPAEAIKTVGIMGNFLFYESNLTGHTCETGMMDNETYYNPHQYRPGLEALGMPFYEEMEKGADGGYSITYDLPAGRYSYCFVVNAVEKEGKPGPGNPMRFAIGTDGKLHGYGTETLYFVDPANPPLLPTITGQAKNSILELGTGKDFPWLPGAPADQRGEVHFISYEDVEGKPQSMGVYLPVGYSRDKVYPAVFVSHGGGGTETDWFHYSGIHHIMDNLIAAGETKEAIIITMNNSVYQWNYEKIAANLYDHILPTVLKLFPVSADAKEHAFCGLSMGSMTTLYLYMHHNKGIQYFGAFSGGMAEGNENFSLEDPALAEKTLFIGCGEEDIAWNFRDIGIPTTIQSLRKKGLPFTEYFTTGGHDNNCWCQMFAEFARSILWK